MSEGRQTGAAFAGLSILVEVEEAGWGRVLGPEPEATIRRAVDAAGLRAGLPVDIVSELGVTLSNDESVRELNAQWRGQDKATNVLSFPMRPIEPGERPGPLLGDIVLALQTCEREALDEGRASADHAVHLLVHGVLHLLGHDHLDETSAERMERLEVLALADLAIEDPYRVAGAGQATHPQDIRRWT